MARLLLPAALVVPNRHPASAFENRLPPDEIELKYKTPRSPGPKPVDLGPRPGGTLKACTDGKPHCFSSTADEFDDAGSEFGTSDWLVAPFKFEKPVAEAFDDVKEVVSAYRPGQRGIDGGGFRVITADTKPDEAYMYVQFESRRRGYIDDFEIALKGGVAHLRTSSRLGYTDNGVNAKRWNYFAEALASRGWTTTKVLSKGHEDYFVLNRMTDRDMVPSS